MRVLRQLILGAAVVACVLFIWISYVPSAIPFLDRIGVLGALNIPASDLASGDEDDRGSPGADRPTQVVTAQVQERVIADRISAIGDGRAERAVTVRSRSEGVIRKLTQDAGNYVQTGAVIARLEDEAEVIALEQAQVLLEDARDEAERVKLLAKSGAVTGTRLRETELATRNAELGLRKAEFDLGQRLIEAPISGWVGIIDVEVGDRVSAQDTLTTITDRANVLIDFRVPERVIGLIDLGQSFDVTPLGLRGTTLTGHISAIDTIVDRASRTLRVQGTVANTNDLLRAGMAFAVSMEFPGETLLAIEPLALQWSSEGSFVWAVRDGKAAQVPVTIRQRNSDSVLVESEDLKVDDTIVTEGVQTLRNGSEVTPALVSDTAAGPARPSGT